MDEITGFQGHQTLTILFRLPWKADRRLSNKYLIFGKSYTTTTTNGLACVTGDGWVGGWEECRGTRSTRCRLRYKLIRQCKGRTVMFNNIGIEYNKSKRMSSERQRLARSKYNLISYWLMKTWPGTIF